MKKKKIKYTNKEFFIIFVLVVFLLTLGALVGRHITLQEDCFFRNEIPSKAQINMICEFNNYEYGWLDPYECNTHQVRCFKQLEDGSQRVDCISTIIVK